MSTDKEKKYSEDELYSLFLLGDTRSYDALMLQCKDSLIFYLYGYLHDWQDAEDLMIEAFARIMVKRPLIEEGGFKAYLYKTARNLTARLYSRKVRFGTFSIDGFEEILADPALSEETVWKDEKRRILMRCLERLDPQFREAIWLVYMEDMNYAEAAKTMRVSKKKVDNLLFRGKQQLRKELEEEGITTSY